MALTSADEREFGWKAEDFSLPATDGGVYSLSDIKGPRGTVLYFICNHCPYVIGVIDRLVNEAVQLDGIGVGVAAICSNDAINYPADSFPKMREFAAAHNFAFPYLHDESQDVARAYRAVCTPDIFGFNAEGELRYRGRLDGAGKASAGHDTKRDLFMAMQDIARTGTCPEEGQIPSMGCSIKWRMG
ncbi:MAG: thioredoxin family protein [Rhodobacteraceae bacterium]|nr:thioredoxin family protein [Paracoccaceae bacterium]